MFEYSEKDNVYVARIDTAIFCCKNVKVGYENIAMQLSYIYEKKLSDIVEFISEDIQEMFGPLTHEEIKSSLGIPMIDLDRNIISYLEHTLDDIHIIDIEYSGLFEQFYEVIIDG